MSENYFLELCTKEKYPVKDLSLFKEAMEIAKEYLQNKRRLSGDSYWDHNLRVAEILVENHSSPEVILAGLLHGLPLEILEKKIKLKFGNEIILLIKGEEEIKQIRERNQLMEAEALRRILLTTVQDVRVMIIKLADKLDNLRSVEALPLDERNRIAWETLEIYAPLAYRLGMEKIKSQLEDLSLQILEPKQHQEISTFIHESNLQREKNVQETIDLIKKITQDKIKIIKMRGRPKHIYSIYKKIKEKNVSFNKLYDLMGIRVVVPEVKDCYTLLGLLHEHFEPVEGRLKDYITNPKPNFYRSIHTTLNLPAGRRVEIQIRTPEMDEFAEEGIAAHWKYKNIKSEENFEKKMGWLKGILELQKEMEYKEFLEAAKVDLFGDEIYCYTPKGAVKQLPLGATILDFAYAVHEEIGNHAIGGLVNGKFFPLKHELSSGDVVEISTNKNQRPRMAWVKFVKSSRAKQKIRKVLKEYEKGPALHYRNLKPLISEEQGILVESSEYPQAICILAKCCLALPGDTISGLITKRRIISVHRTDCREALKEESRWVKVKWKESFAQKIKFFVRAEERSGLLADLLHTIATAGFEVKEAKAKLIDLKHALCSFIIIPRDLEHLKELVKKIQKIKSVMKIYFE